MSDLAHEPGDEMSPLPPLPPAVLAVVEQLARTIVVRELERRREPGT